MQRKQHWGGIAEFLLIFGVSLSRIKVESVPLLPEVNLGWGESFHKEVSLWGSKEESREVICLAGRGCRFDPRYPLGAPSTTSCES